MMRLRTDLSGRPLPRQNARLRTRLAKLEAAQRLGLRPAYSSLRCEAAAQAAYRRMMRLRAGLPAGPYLVLECKAAYHAARRARSGLGSAFRPAYSAPRCEAAAQAALPPCEAASGWPLGPALTPLECEVAYHAARQARSG